MAVSFIGGGNRKKTTDLSQVTDKLYHFVQSTPRMSGVRTHNFSGDMHRFPFQLPYDHDHYSPYY